MENEDEKFEFFQEVQLWPLTKSFDYKGWLQNFSEDDQRLARQILESFLYINDSMIDQMLSTNIANVVQFASTNINWDYTQKCIFSLMPGETPKPTDSGYIFTRKLRDVVGISESNLIEYSSITKHLNEYPAIDTIVLVDDILITGNQCLSAWVKKNPKINDGMSLQEIQNKLNKKVIYAPLIAVKGGHDAILKLCPGLTLYPLYLLNEEYNLFRENCICWNGNRADFEHGIAMIHRVSKELEIPDSGSTAMVEGYGKHGLFLAFAHGFPDGIPAFFYWQSDNWRKLLH